MPARRPNVILIFMDDMTHWSLASSEVELPNLRRLRERGTTFTHAFNQGSLIGAVCLPARQMLLSGLTLFNADTSFMQVQHLGSMLTAAGYDTFFTGKWHNEREALDTDYATVGPCVVGGMLATIDVTDDAYERPRDNDTWSPSDPARGGHWMDVGGETTIHSSERWTNAAVGFLEADHHDKPYFLHLAYHAPHDPRQAPQEFVDRYNPDDIRIPENFLPEHPFDNGSLDIRDEHLAPMPRTEHAVQVHRGEYFAMLTHVDREIGRLLDRAAQFDAEQGTETIVVFSGDHGLALGEHGLFGKQNLYDHSVRVPLVFAGASVPQGNTVDELVYSGSIYSTICDLVKLDVPSHIQFSSLEPVLRDGQDAEQSIFTAYGMKQRAIRNGRYKLISYSDAVNDQLFDLVEDPWELTNLITSPELQAVVAGLRTQLSLKQVKLHDPLLRDRAYAESELG